MRCVPVQSNVGCQGRCRESTRAALDPDMPGCFFLCHFRDQRKDGHEMDRTSFEINMTEFSRIRMQPLSGISFLSELAPKTLI